jgi:hypothetical protein
MIERGRYLLHVKKKQQKANTIVVVTERYRIGLFLKGRKTAIL